MILQSLRTLTLCSLTLVCLNSCEKKKANPTPSTSTESKEERAESIKSAFKENNVLKESSEEELQLIAQNYFEDFNKALESNSPHNLERLLSTDALFYKIESSGALKGKSSKFKRDLKKGLKKGFGRGLHSVAGLLKSDVINIVRCERISNNEFIAYTSCWCDDFEVSTKMRWWLIKDSKGKWLMYDYEDFDMNMRATNLMVTMAQSISASPPAWFKDFKSLIMILRGANSDNMLNKLQAINKSTSKLIKHSLPDDVYVFTHLMHASSLISSEKFKEGMKHLDLIEKKRANIPSVPYLRSTCYQNDERWDDAIAELNKYVEFLGEGPDVCEQLADCYIAKEDYKTALTYAKKGIEINPSALGCLSSYCLCLPEEKHDEVIPYLNKSRRSEAAYEMAIYTFINNEHHDTAKSLLKLMKEKFPQSSLVAEIETELESVTKE